MNGCTVQVFVSALIAQTPGVLTTHAHGENLGCVQQQPRCCWTVSLMRLYADDACLGWLRAIINALVQDLIRAPLPWALTRVTSADANGVPVTGQHSEEANTCLSSCWFFIRTPEHSAGSPPGSLSLLEMTKNCKHILNQLVTSTALTGNCVGFR